MESAEIRQNVADDERLALVELTHKARRRAGELGHPVLVCHTASLGRHDALQLARTLHEEQAQTPDIATAQSPGAAEGNTGGEFRFYWEKPSQQFALAGGGVAADFTSSGADRFHQVSSEAQGALDHALTGGEVDMCRGPILVGGFSFFDQLDQDEWRGFEPGRLVVPRWLVRGHQGETVALVSAMVHPEGGAVPPEGEAAPPEGEAMDPVHTLQHSLEQLRNAARRLKQTREKSTPSFKKLERSDGKTAWLEVVRKARQAIRDGNLAKVVLARAMDLQCEFEPSPYTLLERLRGTYPDCYNFMVDNGTGPVFMGASMEQLARFSGDSVTTAAVAGTVPRGATQQADEVHARHLLASHKERQEHQIVVEGIVDAISAFGKVDRPTEPGLLKLKYVQHLYTPITLHPVGQVPALSLLARLHPTSAVGGHPREEAFALIKELEHFDRGWYASPVGWLNAQGQGEFAVALRSVTINGQRMRLFAGGGIVADSDPEREYEETQMKFQPILSAMVSE